MAVGNVFYVIENFVTAQYVAGIGSGASSSEGLGSLCGLAHFVLKKR